MGAYINTYFLDLSPLTLLASTFSGFMLKQAEEASFSPEIMNGVLLESRLRAYVKVHPAFMTSVRRLKAKHARYGDQIMYVFYDHMMAQKIKAANRDYHTEITQRINTALQENKILFSYNSKRAINSILKRNILQRFDTIDGMHQLMICLHKYNFSSSKINTSIASIEDLIENYEFIHADFENVLSSLKEDIVKKIALTAE